MTLVESINLAYRIYEFLDVMEHPSMTRTPCSERSYPCLLSMRRGTFDTSGCRNCAENTGVPVKCLLCERYMDQVVLRGGPVGICRDCAVSLRRRGKFSAALSVVHHKMLSLMQPSFIELCSWCGEPVDKGGYCSGCGVPKLPEYLKAV